MSNPERKNNRLVCLVKTDYYIYANVPPLGLLYLGNALKRAGYEVRVYHVLDDEVDECARMIIDEKPLFVGFSVLTGLGIKSTVSLSKIIKRAGNIPVVWGNVHPSLLPEQCLNEDYVDIVCIGDGEETAVELARALEKGDGPVNIRGIGYKQPDGRIKINEERPFVKDLDEYEIDWSLVDIERYINPGLGFRRTLRIIASRGCPYNCTFCYNQAYNKRMWRAHSADYVIEKFSALAKRFDIAAYSYNDDNFFVNKGWAWKILEGINLPYYVKLRAEYVDKEFARRLASTGCESVLFGYESGSERILEDVLKKGSTVKDHVAATVALAEYPRIKVSGSFMTALPGEGREDFKKTTDMICRLLELHPNINLRTFFFRPLPGTELYETAIREGFTPPSRTEDWQVFDLLAEEVELPWVDKETKERIEGFSRALGVLDTLYKFKVPGLKKIVSARVLKENYGGMLISFVDKLRSLYASGDRGRGLTRVIRNMADVVKRLKRIS